MLGEFNRVTTHKKNPRSTGFIVLLGFRSMRKMGLLTHAMAWHLTKIQRFFHFYFACNEPWQNTFCPFFAP